MSFMKPKRKEKRKNQRSMWGLIALLCCLILLFSGIALYLMQSQAEAPGLPTPVPTVNPVQPFADICAVTDGRYQIQTVEPAVNRQQVFTLDEQHLLTVDERGVFLGTAMQPTLTRLFAPGLQFAIHASPDSRFFALYGVTGLYIVRTENAEMRLISEKATYFDGWSPGGEYMLFREEGQFILGYVENGRVRALPPQYGYVTEFGWSPDARYLEVYYLDGTTPKIRILDVATFEQINLDNDAYIYGKPSWSPDGNAVAYVDYSGGKGEDGNFAYMVVINPSEKLLRKSALFTSISKVERAIYPVWSPDSQYIAVFQYNHDSYHYEVLVDRVDGQKRVYVADDVAVLPGIFATGRDMVDLTAYRAFFWSEDSEVLYYWREPHESEELSLYQLSVTEYFARGSGNETGEFTLYQLASLWDDFDYDVSSGRVTVTYPAQNGGTGTSFLTVDASGDNQMIHTAAPHTNKSEGVYAGWRWIKGELADVAGRYRLEVLNLHEDELFVLAAGTDMGDPLVSADARYIAATWSNAHPEYDDPQNRRVNITWASVDGSETYTLKNDFKSVYDLLWTEDNDWLAYTYWRKDDTQDDTGVEMVNTRTKHIIPLLTDTKSIEKKEHDTQTGIWTVWWTDFDDQSYVSAFDAAGLTLFDMEIETIAVSTWHRDILVRGYETLIVPSPTTGAIAFKFRQQHIQHEYFYLYMPGNGHIQANVSGLGDPIWSDDGQYVMWTEYIRYGRENWLKVADATGNVIYQEDTGYRVPQFIWAGCEEETS